MENPLAFPVVTTTYVFTVTNASGCSASDSMTIYVNPAPTAPTVTQSGSDLVTTATGDLQWYLDGNPVPGATNQTFTPTESGNYYVVYTDDNGCSATSNMVTGLGDWVEKLEMTIFPNPNNGTFFLQLNGQVAATFTLSIVDLLGREISRQTVQAGNTSIVEINAGEISSGIYHVVLKNENYFGTHKIVIEK